MPILLYGSETWTLYAHEIRQLRTFQQRHLRTILKIKWDDFISNEEVLRRSNVEDIEISLAKSKLRWFGHVARMDDSRHVKMLLYGERTDGCRLIGRPKLRFKDNIKSLLKIRDLFISSSSSSCRACTGIFDSSFPLFSVVHCCWKLFGCTSCI